MTDSVTVDVRANITVVSLSRPDTRDADMAALARSVAISGLKARIAAFRAASAR